MKLYFSPGACALASQIALREAGLIFDLVRVDLRSKESADGNFWDINPKGYIPVLKLNDGQVLTEGAAILQWVADQKPEKSLIPRWGTPERYRAIEWLNFISTELHKGIGGLFNATFAEEARANIKERVGKRLEYVDQQLAQKPWLMGSDFSVCDAYLYNIVRWTVSTKIDISAHKNLLGFMERMQLRPNVIESLKAEGLEK